MGRGQALGQMWQKCLSWQHGLIGQEGYVSPGRRWARLAIGDRRMRLCLPNVKVPVKVLEEGEKRRELV